MLSTLTRNTGRWESNGDHDHVDEQCACMRLGIYGRFHTARRRMMIGTLIGKRARSIRGEASLSDRLDG